MKHIVVVLLAMFGLTMAACSPDGTGAFCAIAETSSDERRDYQIDDYYERLEAAAPDEIRDDVATLREGWNVANLPLEELITGRLSEISRPPEVSESAENVFRFVEERCGFKGGVYLIMPEAGY